MSPRLVRLVARELFDFRDELNLEKQFRLFLLSQDLNVLIQVIAKIGELYCLDGLVLIKHYSDNSISVRFIREFTRHPFYDRLPF